MAHKSDEMGWFSVMRDVPYVFGRVTVRGMKDDVNDVVGALNEARAAKGFVSLTCRTATEDEIAIAEKGEHVDMEDRLRRAYHP